MTLLKNGDKIKEDTVTVFIIAETVRFVNNFDQKRRKTMSCLFCKIIAGEIPSAAVYSDDAVYAFKDINPQAPVHVLVVPREHIESADKIDGSNASAVAAVFESIPKIAAACGLGNGYRVITNVGEDGCQSVKHIHFHVLGGEKLPENMGN